VSLVCIRRILRNPAAQTNTESNKRSKMNKSCGLNANCLIIVSLYPIKFVEYMIMLCKTSISHFSHYIRIMSITVHFTIMSGGGVYRVRRRNNLGGFRGLRPPQIIARIMQECPKSSCRRPPSFSLLMAVWTLVNVIYISNICHNVSSKSGIYKDIYQHRDCVHLLH